MLAALWRKPIVEANAWECQSINESWVKSLESWMLRGFESRVSVQLVFRPASFWRPWRGIPWGPQWSESGSWNASAGCKRRSSSGCMRSTGFRDGGSASASGGAVWVLKFSDLTAWDFPLIPVDPGWGLDQPHPSPPLPAGLLREQKGKRSRPQPTIIWHQNAESLESLRAIFSIYAHNSQLLQTLDSCQLSCDLLFRTDYSYCTLADLLPVVRLTIDSLFTIY